MTTSSEAAAGLVSELRTIAEYVCWDKFEDRFISDPKKHPAWRAADALAARDARIAELEAAKMTAWPKKKVADLPKPSNPAEPGREAVAWRFRYRDGALWNFSQDPSYIHDLNADVFLIEPLYATSPDAAAEIERLHGLLGRCRTVLGNMARENEGAIFNRWPINHEPLRHDAKNLLPLIDEEIGHEE